MRDLQDTIRRNVKVLMATRGVKGARELARLANKGENAIAQKLSGRRNWQLEDLSAVAVALGVRESDLLRNIPEIVNSNLVATGTESGQMLNAATPNGPTSTDVIPAHYTCNVRGNVNNRARHLRVVA